MLRRHGEGEPEVVVGALPGVVVADAGMTVDFHGGAVQFLGLEGHRNQGGLVAQPPGVEDGADLAENILALELGEPGQNVVLGDFQLLSEVEIGLLHHGEGALDQVEQLAVNNVHSRSLGQTSSHVVNFEEGPVQREAADADARS